MGSAFSYNTKEWLYSAIDSSNQQLVKQILLENPKWVNEPMTTDCLTTPLGKASWRNDVSIMELLISLGADVNYSGPSGQTPLIWAARRGNLNAVQYLLERLPDVDIRSPEGFNALDWAILYGQYNVSYFLMQKTHLKPLENIEQYQTHAIKTEIMYFDYKIIVDNLILKVSPELVPKFNEKPDTEPKFIDPVIDPRESWKDFIKRTIEFEDPPLVERSELPSELQPQNRFFGKIRAYINGRTPYPEAHTNLKGQYEKIAHDQQQKNYGLNLSHQNIIQLDNSHGDQYECYQFDNSYSLQQKNIEMKEINEINNKQQISEIDIQKD